MTLVLQHQEQDVRIPAWVVDLASFRRWATSDDFPVVGWYGHLNGELWADISMERLLHNELKTQFTIAIGGLAGASKLGQFFSDRMLLTNLEADLSTEPDGMYIHYETLQSQRARFLLGDDSKEVVGTPDIVIEIVSPTSRKKDTQILRESYYRARIPEYWLVEPARRDERVAFDILRWQADGYVPVPENDGWLHSTVLDKDVRLAVGDNPMGKPSYRVEIR